MKIIKIVLTGGPCAGKTTALSSITKYLKENNIHIITVPETASELILNNQVPINNGTTYNFQSLVLKKQLSKEQIAEDYINDVLKSTRTCVIIYDRGILDNKAYLNNRVDINRLLEKYNLTEIGVLDSYDLVLDLLSLATCKKDAYNFSNKARMEDVESAEKVDRKTSLAWIAHRNLKIIDSSVSLEEETEIILSYIKELLEGNQIKNKRKFIVDDSLSDYKIYNENNSETLYITDFFIKVEDANYNYVVSRREHNNDVSYVYSVYSEEGGKRKYTYDKKITEEEYYELLINNRIIRKENRKEINFYDNRQKYTLCFYGDYTILEIEENKQNREIIFPSNLEITEELGNNKIKVRKK